jgi:hypothetical protein
MTFAGNDKGSENERRKEALRVLNLEWGSKIETGAFEIVWRKGDELITEYSVGFNALKEYLLRTIDRNFYPCGFEWRFNIAANMYKTGAAKQGVKSAVNGSCEGTFNNPNKLIKTEQVIESAWGTSVGTKYWEGNPTLAVSILKKKIEEKIAADFKSEGRVSIRSIYDIVKEKPFGLMPNNITAFILGFVLREYATDQYRYTDDQTSDVMNSAHLQTMIDEIIKLQEVADKRYRDKYIVTLTPEEKEFHVVASTIFGISIELCTSIQTTRDRVRNKMKELSFPIWTLKNVISDGSFNSNAIVLSEVIDLFGELANSGNQSEVDIANKIGKLSLANVELKADLVQLVSKENCRSGMAKYLLEYKNGALIELANEINDGGQYLNVVAAKFTDADAANWVWNQSTANQRIDEAIVEYSIIVETNKILGTKAYKLTGAIGAWKSQCSLIRISYDVMKDKIGGVTYLLAVLKDVVTIGQLLQSKNNDFYTQLQNHGGEVKAFFDNQKEVFKTVCAFQLEGLFDDDIDAIFKLIPTNNIFVMAKSDYINLVDGKISDYRKNQKKEQLRKLWKEKTQTDSPKAWSEKYKTPILCMVPDNDVPTAKKTFACFGGSVQSDAEVEDAIKFISYSSFIQDLSDMEKRDEAFKRTILKEYAEILVDCNVMRDYLAQYFLDVYDWYGNLQVDSRIKSYAEHDYSTKSNARVVAIIEKMDAAELKEYLLKLAKDDVSLGISILKNNL